MPAATDARPAPLGHDAPIRTRDDLLRLGQSGQSWKFLSIVAQVLGQHPDDHGLRFWAGVNLAKLGLRTLATELTERLPPVVREHPEVADLRNVLSGLSDDRVAWPRRQQIGEANGECLVERGVLTPDAVRVWCERGPGAEYFRALDGNVVRRGEGSPAGELRACNGVFDHRGVARAFGAQFAQSPERAGGVVVEGCDPPWAFLSAWEVTPSSTSGQATAVVLLAPDVKELMDGLSHADLRAVLTDPRVRVFAGDSAEERLRSWLRERGGYRQVHVCFETPTLRSPGKVRARALVAAAVDEQSREMEALKQRVNAWYAPKNEAYWAARFEEIRAGRGEALRVLIPTCRFSTFVRHAAADQARAFERLGASVRVLVEPDASTPVSIVSYLRALDEHKPDLVVLINYPRSTVGEWLPRNLAWVCWIQDAMPQILKPETGNLQGALDFVVGHVFPELFTKFGYDERRALPAMVVADGDKFHAGAVSVELRRRHECEVALVSHHSESPGAMRERLEVESGGNGAWRRCLRLVWEDVQRCVAASAEVPLYKGLSIATLERVRSEGGCEPTPEVVSRVLRNYALPLADRLLRHQAVAWASELATERGWRFHLYGRGWEKHERFGVHARGELEHGEELRAAYQCARAQLHVSATTLAHQRVVECALSGGLCLCRWQRDAVAGAKGLVQSGLLAGEPDETDSQGRLGYRVADHADAMALAALLARLGHPLESGVLWIEPERAANLRRAPWLVARDQDACWLLVDPAETTFRSKETLAALLTRAVENDAWRSNAIEMVAGRARAHLTHDALARNIVEFVSRGLRGGCGQDAAGVAA